MEIWCRINILFCSYRFKSTAEVFLPQIVDGQRNQTTDTETDPETYSKVNDLISKKFQVSHFRDVPEFFQRKGEIVLQLPIEEFQFQQFCKQLNTKEISLCRDLLEKELYGK